MNYEYFEYDNAVFRRPAGVEGPVTEYKGGDGTWKPYKGSSAVDVLFYGNAIMEEEANAF